MFPIKINLKNIFQNLSNDIVKCGKIPEHVAFVMDGNRRYSKIKDISKKLAYKMGACNLVNVSCFFFKF